MRASISAGGSRRSGFIRTVLRSSVAGGLFISAAGLLLAETTIGWPGAAGAAPVATEPAPVPDPAVTYAPAERETAPVAVEGALPTAQAAPTGGWIKTTEVYPSSAFNPAPPEVKSSGSTGWIVNCPYSHSNNDDPIVFPNQVGKSHTHAFQGSTTVNANWIAGSQTMAAASTCRFSKDKSAYWMPTLYQDGKAIYPRDDVRNSKGERARQKMYYRNPTYRKVQPMPFGLRMLVGNHAAKSVKDNPDIGSHIFWGCSDNSQSSLSSPPKSCGTQMITTHLHFPSCWDGKHLDSPDHRSHVAYPSGGKCPSSHPVVIPRITIRNEYIVGKSTGTITFATGADYTIHGDFINGWDPATMRKLVDGCMNAGKNCETQLD